LRLVPGSLDLADQRVGARGVAPMDQDMSALGRELRCDITSNAVSRARDQHGLACIFIFRNSPEAIGPSRWNQRAGKSRRQYNAPIAVYAAVLRGGAFNASTD